MAADLIACQEPDGYLGTYVPEKRFGLYEEADWDVWSHKYNLIGLLTYYQYTGNAPALCLLPQDGRPADRHVSGQEEHSRGWNARRHGRDQRLEPVVLLYRFTGDKRYLEFARYIVKAWDEPGGPAIAASLRAGKGVNKTANGKAYEMLSNLVGLCELARATGDRGLLVPVQNAWSDIVENRLYLTGSASAGEVFRDDHVLPNQVARPYRRDLRHDHLDSAQSSAPEAHGQPKIWRRTRAASITIWPPPSILVATIGATTRPSRVRSHTIRASTAVIPAARAAWPWRCRQPTSDTAAAESAAGEYAGKLAGGTGRWVVKRFVNQSSLFPRSGEGT